MTETAIGSARALAAELIGAFALIFIGAGAAIALGVNHDPSVAFAHGHTIGPAVAAGLYREVPLYVAAQLVGAIFAAALYRWFRMQQRTPGTVTAQSRAAAD